MANIVQKIESLIAPTVEQMGYTLWDVRFLKEGAEWYLRIFIDKEDGISINDCTDVSHAIDPIIDEADPISQSYYLEVCSPGVERELKRDSHFESQMGREIKLHLFKAQDGERDFCGVLSSYENGNVTLDIDGELRVFEKGSYATAKLNDMQSN